MDGDSGDDGRAEQAWSDLKECPRRWFQKQGDTYRNERFVRRRWGWSRDGNSRWSLRASAARGLYWDQLVQIDRLCTIWWKIYVTDRSIILYSIRSLILIHNGSGVTAWTRKVFDLLESVQLRIWKIVVQQVAIVKFDVDTGGGDGTGSCEVKVRTDTAKFANIRIKNSKI